MTPGHEIADFQVLSTLGYGARSTIFSVSDESGQIYALKRVVKRSADDQRFIDQAIQEHEIASQIEHPNLRKSIKLIRQRKLIRVTEVLVLMELIDGVTLEQKKPKSLIDLCRLMQQVTAGIGAMHDAGYVHADLKPSNIMVNRDKKVKIIDFGQSCKIGTAKERIQGTPDYIAPEQVKRKPITQRTDSFNLGATMFWLLTGKHVPTMIPKGKAGVTMRDNDKAVAPREINPEIPPALSSLVMSCIQTDPTERPESMAVIHNRLELSISQLTRAADSLAG